MNELDDIQRSIIILALDNLLISNKTLLEELKDMPEAKDHIQYMEFLDQAIPLIIDKIGKETNTESVQWDLLSKK